MELIKRHKGLAIVGSLTLILLIIIFIISARMIFTSGNSEYGDRLNGIVKINKSVTDKVLSEIGELEEVEKITTRAQGKIIYTTITFTEATKKDKAKEIANKVLTYYDEEVINCYDFEFLLTQNIEVEEGKEDPSYTVAGTKHPDNEKISWTKN